MSKLNEDMIGRIQAYPKEMTNIDVGKELGIDRRTVAKYRQMREETQQETTDLLSGKEEEMRRKRKVGELPPDDKLTKADKKKLDLLQHYSPKDIQEMLTYIATTSKREIDEAI